MDSVKTNAVGTKSCNSLGSSLLHNVPIMVATTSHLLLKLGFLSVLLIGVAGTAQAQKERVLYSFRGTHSGPDGALPQASLLRDTRANLYGTTFTGGAYGYGTVFTVTPSGAGRVLYSFRGGPDGAMPRASLIQSARGILYSTTERGGAYNCGTVFKVTSSGAETVLYHFRGAPDGCFPLANLTLDAAGQNLYGTTYGGGAYAKGTVFVLSLTGVETVLHSFTGGADGQAPWAGLIQDAQGNLYGTTLGGGAYYWGTVFMVSPSGTETVLYSFTGAADGGAPYASLIQDAQGNLYGTTSSGGAYNSGTVFVVDPSGAETVLYSFMGGADGGDPRASLIQDGQGNLYGTTASGGAYLWGTVFSLSSSGAEQVLYSFKGGADGVHPYASLIQDAQGNLYGTTEGGGAYGYFGTVFVLLP